MTPFDVIVAGELYIDLVMSGFDFWPQPGTEAFAKTLHRQMGGGAAITASGLAQLGSRTAVFGVVGSDAHEWLEEALRHKGIDTSCLIIHPGDPTGLTVVASSPQDRAFLTYSGANRRLYPLLHDADAVRREFSKARHVHLACAPALETAAEVVASVRGTGRTVSLDVGWHEPWLSDPRALALIARLDIFFPNQSEAVAMTSESDPVKALARFRDAGARRVALKLGARGAVLLWDDVIHRAEPLRVTPRDTTGAGDCFDAGFLHSWLRGDPPERALRIANICGALSTESYGGIEGFPTPERVRAELEKQSCEE